jgi:hypothetical protein
MNTKTTFLFTLLLSFFIVASGQDDIYGKARLINEKDDGYRGIWYHIAGAGSAGPIPSEYRYKYSGGLGTYPANHYPFSVYAEEVNKTFFCYGGTDQTGKTLLHMVSYFDHDTRQVPRPTVVLDKATGDAHDNPVMQIDKEGYIWIFSTSHGTGRPSFVHKSKTPYDISSFERIPVTKIVDGQRVPMDNFSYLQMYYSDEDGFTGLFTLYEKVGGRVIKWMTSKDGENWSEWKTLSHLGQGQYQTSGNKGNTIGTSFNYHPRRKIRGGLDFRTNLYYLETTDFGKTWHTSDGQPIELPLTEVNNKALVHDFDSKERNVYIADLNFDKKGRPIILFITSSGPLPGPEGGPRMWKTAWWNGRKWRINDFTEAGNNYDAGSVYIMENGNWKIIAPTVMGPQPYNTGGEMEMWNSKNNGKSWKKLKKLTNNSIYNHTYARRPINVHPDFYAFWADGHGREKSKSRLYFSDKNGNVYKLPEIMESEYAKPILIKPVNNITN